jgi:DNA-binding response OmpR family regulator
MSSSEVDLLVLDGEARPAGGMGLAKQLKDELLQPPPIVVLTARDDDAWLAGWSGADAIVSRTLDPIVTIDAVTPLLRSRLIL